MKKIIFVSIAVLSLGGGFAVADMLLPNQIVVQGDTAQKIATKITQVTGNAGQTMGDRMMHSANAHIQCVSMTDGGALTCKISIQK